MVVKDKTITLVMIVKNESETITRCFDSVKDHIDYWVICDTGSTDGTQKKIGRAHVCTPVTHEYRMASCA